MTSGYPLSQAEKDEIVELSTNGLNGGQIASRLGLGASTIYRVLRHKHGKRQPTSVVIHVVSDPMGIFSPGAEFTMLDLARGVYLRTWSEGTVFDVNGRYAHIEDGALLRDDGRRLKTWSSGHKWTG